MHLRMCEGEMPVVILKSVHVGILSIYLPVKLGCLYQKSLLNAIHIQLSYSIKENLDQFMLCT